MTAATMQQTPIVPPRPSRPSEKDSSTSSTPSIPIIPPRPAGKRLDRSVSPGTARFARSPLNEHVKATKNLRFSPHDGAKEPIQRPSSVSMPSVGEEGMEYSNVANDIQGELQKPRAISPEHTRTVGDELHLHAPKASLPAIAAKRQVMQVTRTDSDKAAQFGIGRANPDERSRSQEPSLRKRPSTSMSNSSDHNLTDGEHGIPEIGQRVPMSRHLGDVQAPSPTPGNGTSRHHTRRHSARNCPPGSYGLHAHGSAPLDKLDQEYYQKHPELKAKEKHNPLLERQNDYAMSGEDLNKLVRDTPNRHSFSRLSGEYRSTPTDEAAFQVTDRYASRMTTPHDSPAVKPQDSAKGDIKATEVNGEIIHVDDPRHPEYRSYGDEDPAEAGSDHEHHAPILAADEVQKDAHRYLSGPAVHPAPERHGSAFEENEGPSRPPSRPHSLHKIMSHPEFLSSTHLDDVDEYEPLFDEEKEKQNAAAAKKAAAEEIRARRHFPSKDIWEDAPESVHYSAEVRTPDPEEYEEQYPRSRLNSEDGRSLTPAQAFAQHQEELAEKEARGPGEYFTARPGTKPKWVDGQTHLNKERPSSSHRFPSRDIWEDVPESQLQSATVTPLPDEEKPQIPSRPVKKLSDPSEKPSIPERPKTKQLPGEDVKARPPVSDKPKPQVPTRPAKSSSGDSIENATAKAKPPVPSRPAGGKISALQAGFMSDLNKKLGLGPQAQKKDEPQEPQEEKEKVPLSDARKGRARGPQRRVPPRATGSTEPINPSKLVLSFSLPQTSWAIDPDQGSLAVDSGLEKEVKGLPSDEPNAAEVETAAINADQAGESVHIGAPDGPAVSAENPVLSEQPRQAEELEEEDEEEDEELDDEPEKPTASKNEEPHVEEKTLVANTAGESILETEVQKGHGEVEPVEVKDDVKA